MRVMLGQHKAYVHFHTHTVLVTHDKAVLPLIENLLVPWEARHNFTSLQEYNTARIHAVQATNPCLSSKSIQRTCIKSP